MFELLRWKEREIQNLKRDLEGLLEQFMSHYGLWTDPSGRLLDAIRICEEQGIYHIEVALPELDPHSLRVYLTGRSLVVVGRRLLPHMGYKDFRKVIELPFRPREGEIQVNYSENSLRLKLQRSKKRTYRLTISQL